MNIHGSSGQGVYGPSDGGSGGRQATGRVPDLIQQLRTEFDAVAEDIKAYRGLREEFQRKVEEQITEMSNLERELVQMEQKNQHLQEQYDAEILRLKKQLSGAPLPPPSTGVSRDDPITTLPGLASRDAVAPSGSAQLTSSFPGSQGGGAPPNKRGRSSDGKGTTTGTAPPLGSSIGNVMSSSLPGGIVNPVSSSHLSGAGFGSHPLASNGLNSDAARSGTSTKEDTTDTRGEKFGSSTNAGIMGLSNNQDVVSASNNSAHPPETDYIVYQGRTSSGTLLNMSVKLQNSFAHDSVVCCVRYSWSGQYLSTGSNKHAQIFDAATGAKIATFGPDDNADRDEYSSQDSYIRAVCFSPDGKWLITGSEDRLVKVWDVRTRTVKHKLAGHEAEIYSVDASADGKYIASGSGDKKAKLWDPNTGQLLHTLNGPEVAPADGITSVSVSPTSHHVAAGSLDKIVRVWDVESGRLVRSFEGHNDSVYSVAFSPDCRMLLSGSLDKTLKLWDLAANNPTNQCRLSFTGHKDFVLSVAFSPTGRWLISGSKDRTVQFWDPRQPSMCLMLQGHKNSVISIAHSPKGKALATGSGDSRARTWVYTN